MSRHETPVAAATAGIPPHAIRILAIALLGVALAAPSARAQERPTVDDLDSLRAALDSRDAGKRSGAAYSIGQIGAQAAPAVPRLLEMAQRDPDSRSRWMAVRALGWIGGGACGAVPALLALSNDRDDDVRGDVVGALGSLATHCRRRGATDAILDTLQAHLRDTVGWLRAHALAELYQQGAIALPRVAVALRSPDDSLAARAAQMLGASRDSAVAWPALMAALGDRRAMVRDEVADALGGFGAARRVELERAAAAGPDHRQDGARRALRFLVLATRSPVAGRCFRLYIAPMGKPVVTGEDTIFSKPPMVVEFSTRKHGRMGGSEGQSLAVEPADGEGYSIHGPGSWRRAGDSIEVVWSTGFSGLTMQLKASGDSLTGLSRTFWDFPRESETSRVVGRPVPCGGRPAVPWPGGEG